MFLLRHPDAHEFDGIKRASGRWYRPKPIPGMPGYYELMDGSISHPPDDSISRSKEPAEPGPDGSTPDPTCSPTSWNPATGTPPPCTNTGLFRRVYSVAGYNGGIAYVTLPVVATPMPTNPPPDGSTGYTYFEGWPVAGGDVLEGGYQYSADHNWYTLYLRTTTPVSYWISTNHFEPNQTLRLSLWGYSQSNCQSCITVIGRGLIYGCGQCVDEEPQFQQANGNWGSGTCCVMARMTTIGQDSNNFHQGYEYGPIGWASADLCQPTQGTEYCTFGWTGGAQSWPPDSHIINVNYVDLQDETDTIETFAHFLGAGG